MTTLAGIAAAIASLSLAVVWLVDQRIGRLASQRLARTGWPDAASDPLDQRAGSAGAGEGRVDSSAGERGPGGLRSGVDARVAMLVVLVGGLAWLLARQVLASSPRIALALGLDGAIGLALILAVRRERQLFLLESQLASWLRLVASSLRAGLGRVDALSQALAQIGSPLREVLGEPVGRLRLGEDPSTAFAPVADRVPLESFRLFALVVAAQWHAGGSLQNTVGSIGEALQDRVDVARRIQTQAAPTRSSVLTLLAATVAIAVFSHANDPANLERFLASSWGDGLVATALALQGVSLVWIWRLTRTPV